ncbi:MAG TPA: glucosaminidase domain-containing protein [Chitinophagaceae bacterium]|nr:glucosaminidase domain-containing protein [Chitinophagaceae bacterium]
MKLKFLIAIVLFAGSFSRLNAQNSDNLPRPVIVDYINTFKEIAISEMKRTGVPASITLAQGIHETEAGTSILVRKSNNHFGIKCKTGWTGESVSHDDDAKGECFRSYANAEQSYIDHSDFLKNGQRYAFLFRLDPTDFEGWANGLRKAGYATNKKYASILIRIINDYHLQDYTMIALGKMKPEEEWLTSVSPISKPITAPDDAKIVANAPEVISEPEVIYPEGEFKINDTRVVYAKAGASLIGLAEKHDVAFTRLLDFNEFKSKDENTLKRGQLIYLQRKRKAGMSEFHEVKGGESVYDISQAEGIRLESLLEYNFLIPGMQPANGEKLNLRNKAAGRPLLVSEMVQDNLKATYASDYTKHVVQLKETLYAISKKYNVPVEKLREWNKLASYDLRTGQELIIYKN